MAEVEVRDGLSLDPELQVRSWDRQPKESTKAFRAFAIYRDLAGDRTYQKVADQLQVSGSLVRRWGIKNSWYARARDWDIFQDQAAQEAQVRERRRMAERQAQYGVLMQGLAAQELMKLRNSAAQSETNAALDAGEIAKLMDVGSRMERAARGRPDEDHPAKIEIIVELDEPDPDDAKAVRDAMAAQVAAIGPNTVGQA